MAENGVLTIKQAWKTPLGDVSWRNIESIFEVHEEQKTPPRRVAAEPALPAAPRKLNQQIRRQGLKPRRLTYDLSSPDSGFDAGFENNKENQPPPPIQESSGKSRAKRRQVKDVKDSKTKPPNAAAGSELRLRLRI